MERSDEGESDDGIPLAVASGFDRLAPKRLGPAETAGVVTDVVEDVLSWGGANDEGPDAILDNDVVSSLETGFDFFTPNLFTGGKVEEEVEGVAEDVEDRFELDESRLGFDLAFMEPVSRDEFIVTPGDEIRIPPPSKSSSPTSVIGPSLFCSWFVEEVDALTVDVDVDDVEAPSGLDRIKGRTHACDGER